MLQIPVLSTLLTVWSVENIVKVTGKKSGKSVKKTLKATITVKNPALSVSAASEVAVGSTEAIKATVKPANTKVTYTTSDEKIAKKTTTAVYKKASFAASVPSYKAVAYTVTIPKSCLKTSKDKIDLRTSKFVISGKF